MVILKIGNQKGYGFEVEGEWKPTSNFTLKTNYSFQNSEDTNTSASAGNAPKNQIYLNGRWKFSQNWLLSAEVLWVGNRKRVVKDPRSDIDDYTTVDLTLKRNNIFKGLSAAILVQNLLDDDVFEPSPFEPSVPLGSLIPGDYPLAGRSIGGELRYQF